MQFVQHSSGNRTVKLRFADYITYFSPEMFSEKYISVDRLGGIWEFMATVLFRFETKDRSAFNQSGAGSVPSY